MNFFHRIRGKLALAFILVTLIPALSIGIYSIQVSSKSLLNREYSNQLELVGNHKQNVESFLSSVVGDIRFLSESIPLRDYLKKRDNSELLPLLRSDLEREFLQFSRARGIYHQIRYLDENGMEVARVDSKDGQHIIVEQSALQNKFSRYYFQKSYNLPSSSYFVSPLDLNRERGQIEEPYKPVIRYAVAVYYPDGSNAGIVITNVDASIFLQNLKGSKLLDAEGYYLAHPDAAKTWGSKRDLGTGISFTSEHPKVARKIEEMKRGTILTETQVNTFEKVTIPGTRDSWTLVTQRATQDLYASVNQFRLTFLTILGGAFVIAIGLAYYLGARITNPIERLTEMANNVSQGNLLQPVRIRDKSEIGLLGDAFERMRVSMVKSVERLRKKSTTAPKD